MQIKDISAQFWILVKDYLGLESCRSIRRRNRKCTGGSWSSSNNNPTPAGCNANNGRYTPVIVDDSKFPTNSSIISISTGMAHSCAIIDNNDLYCWGRNDGGQLGIGSTDTGDFPLLNMSIVV